jgi:hypothetical protein
MSQLEYLKEKLLEQLDLIATAAEGYDRGQQSQALHIATGSERYSQIPGEERV